MLVGFGIAGQQDGDRDLGTGGLSADLGVRWALGGALEGRFGASAFSVVIGQGCSCDPGDPPLAIHGAYGLLLAAQSRSRAGQLYWLAGVAYKWGGFREWNEHDSAGLVTGLGLPLGRSGRGAIEVRYEYLLARMGSTRALIPLQFVWQL